MLCDFWDVVVYETDEIVEHYVKYNLILSFKKVFLSGIIGTITVESQKRTKANQRL